MATNIKTVMTYQLNGATTDFAIPFEYLARKFVQVTLIGVDRKVLVLNQDYRFATKALISTTRSWGPADGYQLIEIRRYTSAAERLVDFTDGSILRAYDLNISQVQTLHVAEEARDLTADTIGVNNDGNLDARGRKIVNVGEGTEPGDAVSLGQLQKWNDSALHSANNAKASENQAKTYREEAGGFWQETKKLEAQAANSAAYANNRAADSDASAKDSHQWANRSAGSASESAGSAALARKWSSAPRDEVVADGLGSAFHYMTYSKSAQEASSKSAEVAAQEADRAKTEADKLGNMNELAFTIDKITDNINVWWKGQATFRNNLHLRNETNMSNYIAGYKNTGAVDWLVGRDGVIDTLQFTKIGYGSIMMDNTTLSITRNNSQIFMSDNAAEFNSPNLTIQGAVRFRSISRSGPHSVIVHGNEGGDAGNNSLNITTEIGGSGSQINGLRGSWYSSGWVFGGRRGGSKDLLSVGLTVTNTGSDSADFNFGYNGRISVDRGFTIARDGNITGEAWGGGWLTDWAKSMFIGSMSYGAFAKLAWNQGWTDLISPKGHTQVGTNVSDSGLVAAIYVAPLYQHFHNGVSRLVDTGW